MINKMEYSWVEIDLSALVHNLNEVRRVVAPKVEICAVVKADAYGHGAEKIAETLADNGVSKFAVANLKEGKQLRQAGIPGSIILLQPSFPEEAQEIIDFHLTPTVLTLDFAKKLDQISKKRNKSYPVHIKVDTGMGRLGVSLDSFWEFVEKIKNLKNLKIEGVFSHFAKAHSDNDFSEKQLRLFKNLIKGSENKGIHIPCRHMANSAGILNYPDSHFNLVRPGVILYGLYPDDAKEYPKKISLKPVMSLKSRIIFAKEVKAGCGLSYNHTYHLTKKAVIATLPIGYSHGYSRVLSNKTEIIFRGKKYPQTGTICMDSLLVNLGKAEPERGEEVVLMGRQGRAIITAEEIAKKSGTINYEITCRFGMNAEKEYI
ncbi:MAG: alanine racemase [bacterium]|nr:alanine racemase [bacterium]